MQELFSTGRFHVRDRSDFWHSVVSKAVVQHDAQPPVGTGFAATLHGGSIGDIGVFLFENSPFGFVHCRDHINAANSDDLFLCRQVEGQLALQQADREVTLHAGDISLLDPTLPYTGAFLSESKLLLLRVPRRELEARLGRTYEALARGVRPSLGISKLTSSFIGLLPEQTSRLSASAGAAVRTQTLDLIALAFSSDCKFVSSTTSRRSFALTRVRAAIDAKFAEPDVDAKKIAVSAGVSVRYANALLAQQGSSISRLILSTRLARCQKAFEDPRQVHRSLSEIAYGWGFSDMTYFGRAFKRAFGILPSKYRRLGQSKS